MIKKILSSLAIIALAANLSSCVDNESEQSQTIGQQVLAQFDDASIKGSATVKIYFNENKADIMLPADGHFVLFEGVNMSINPTYGYTFSASSAQAKDHNGKSLGYSVTNLSGKMQIGNPSNAEIDNMVFSYTKDDETYFATLPTIKHFTTSTHTSAGPMSHTCTTATYTFVLDNESKTCDIIVNNIQFVQQMPTQSEITIQDVPYAVDDDGYTLVVEKTVPTSAGVPFERGTITDLNISLDAANGKFSGVFTCMGMNCTVNGDIAYPQN